MNKKWNLLWKYSAKEWRARALAFDKFFDSDQEKIERLKKENEFMKTCGVIEMMQRNPNIDSFVREKEKQIEIYVESKKAFDKEGSRLMKEIHALDYEISRLKNENKQLSQIAQANYETVKNLEKQIEEHEEYIKTLNELTLRH